MKLSYNFRITVVSNLSIWQSLPTKRPFGAWALEWDNMGTRCPLVGDHVGTRCALSRDHMGTRCVLVGDHMGTRCALVGTIWD